MVDFAHEIQAGALVKGLRAMTDFECELQQADLNYRLDADLESIFVMSAPQYGYISSSVVRRIMPRLGAMCPALFPRRSGACPCGAIQVSNTSHHFVQGDTVHVLLLSVDYKQTKGDRMAGDNFPGERIESLVDELEGLIEEARPPFGKNQQFKVIETEVFFNILDEIRMSYPEEWQKSRRILKERDELMASATAQADSIIADAQQQALTIAGEQESRSSGSAAGG